MNIKVFVFTQAFPFVFVLMSRKTEAAYFDVFKYINTNVMDLNCAKFTSDYEVSLRNALQKICPTALLVACWFHFCQAVRRFASKIDGFLIFLRSNQAAAIVFQQVLCLPLLPHEHILTTFNLLQDRAFAIDKTKFITFFVYFKRQWLVRVSILLLFTIV